MGRDIPSKKASWGPGPGAVLLQDTPTTAEHKGGPVGRWARVRVGGFQKARLPTAALPQG